MLPSVLLALPSKVAMVKSILKPLDGGYVVSLGFVGRDQSLPQYSLSDILVGKPLGSQFAYSRPRLVVIPVVWISGDGVPRFNSFPTRLASSDGHSQVEDDCRGTSHPLLSEAWHRSP